MSMLLSSLKFIINFIIDLFLVFSFLFEQMALLLKLSTNLTLTLFVYNILR